MKEKFEFQNVVAETLLIPLYMRAKESKRKSQDIIISDPLAESLVNNIDYDYSKFDNAWMSAWFRYSLPKNKRTKKLYFLRNRSS